MAGVSKLSWRVCWPLVPAVLTGALLAVPLGQRGGGSAPRAVSLDDWDIGRLVTYLNGEGLRLRRVSTQRRGVSPLRAYLTTTAKEWLDLDSLPKDPDRIARWRGTLYCERGPADHWPDLQGQWGDCCLVVGPFLFFGDRELLGRVRAALRAPGAAED
jgi:hypothetical protein